MEYVVDSYAIDAAVRELRQGGTPVPVEPKVFDLLLYLVENRHRLVGKDELVDRIWAGRAISDAAMSSCIKAARRVIGDDGQRQRLIRTIHGRGFRFVGPVEATAAATPAPPQTAPAPMPVPVAQPQQNDGDQAAAPEHAAFDIDLTLPQRPSIAVLPIEPLGNDERSPLVAAGLACDLTTRLARTRWLFVTARASAARLHAAMPDRVDIGRQLGVRYLLHGSLMIVDGRLRLTAALADTVQGCEVWAERFDRTIDDLFAVQDEIGDLIVAAVESEIEQKERRRALLKPFSSLDAWSAYHRACHHLYLYTPEHCDRAQHFLELAARLDPNAPRVQAGLSFVHWQRTLLETTPDRAGAIARAMDHARHSVSLDPRDPLGHWALGRAMLFEHNFDRAVEELETAVDLNPNFAVGQYSLAFGASYTSQRARYFDCASKARRLSPYDPMTYAFMAIRAVMHGLMGEPELAAAWGARAVQQPNAHHHVLAIAAWCHEIAGRTDEAHAYIARLRAVRPGYCHDDYFRAFPFPDDQRAIIEGAFGRLGL